MRFIQNLNTLIVNSKFINKIITIYSWSSLINVQVIKACKP